MIMIFCKIKVKNEQFKDMPQNISQNIINRRNYHHVTVSNLKRLFHTIRVVIQFPATFIEIVDEEASVAMQEITPVFISAYTCQGGIGNQVTVMQNAGCAIGHNVGIAVEPESRLAGSLFVIKTI